MRTYTKALALIAVFALLALLAGCGGGDDSTSTSSATSGELTTNNDSTTGGESEESGEGSEGGGGSEGGDAEEAGGSDSGGGSTGTISKAAFIKKGDTVCAKASGKSEAELRPYLEKGLKSITEEAERIVNYIVAPGVEVEVSKLRELPQPEGAAGEQADAIFVAMEEATGQARANPEEYVVSTGVFAKSEQLAKAFGFKVCGGPP